MELNSASKDKDEKISFTFEVTVKKTADQNSQFSGSMSSQVAV